MLCSGQRIVVWQAWWRAKCSIKKPCRRLKLNETALSLSPLFVNGNGTWKWMFKKQLFCCFVYIILFIFIHIVNSIQLQMDCPRSLTEFTPAWLCKGLTSVHEERTLWQWKHTSLNSYKDFEKKRNKRNIVSVFVNQRVGMCTSATVYMQTAFIYVF